MRTVVAITVMTVSLWFSANSGGCRICDGNATRDFYEKISYYLQRHSYYIPVMTSDSVHCVVENHVLFYLLTDNHDSAEGYSKRVFNALCKDGFVNIPIKYEQHEAILTIVNRGITIPEIEDMDKDSIIKQCFRSNGCLKDEYVGSIYEGLIIESLFYQKVAISTDCMTGYIYIVK